MDSQKLDVLRRLVKAGKGGLSRESECSLVSECLSSDDITIRAYASWAHDINTIRTPGIYHVATDREEASDRNDGSPSRPWKTIQKAAETLHAGDTVVIHSGVYRECVRPFHSGTKGFPITYEAAVGEKPVIKAMDVWKTQWVSEGGKIYSTQYTHLPWDKPNRFKPNIPENRCEQIFFDGGLLKNVRTRSELESSDQSFWINDAVKQIWIHVNKIPNYAVIERSVREQCLMPAVRGLEHIHIKGLTFIGGAAHTWSGAKWCHVDQMAVVSVNAGRHWVIENNTIDYGNAQGLQLAVGGCFAEEIRRVPIVNMPEGYEIEYNSYKSLDVSGYNTAYGNKIRYHGISGIVAFVGAVGLVIDDNELVGNCRKNHQGTCEESAIKIHVMKDGIIRRNYIYDNNCYGIWLDGICTNNRITQNTLVNNKNCPIFYELSPGPILIDNNVIFDTTDTPVECGIYNQDGNGSTVINNIIVGPKTGMRVRALFHRKHEGEWTTTSDNGFYNNIVANCNDGCVSLIPEVQRCKDNHSNHNILWNNGKFIQCKVENTSDVGISWENLPLGKALGFTGSGNNPVALNDWSDYFNEDVDSITVSPKVIFGEFTEFNVMSLLIKVWRARGLDFEGGCFKPEPVRVSRWIQLACSNKDGWELLHTIWLQPNSGVQFWKTPEGFMEIPWINDSIGESRAIDLKGEYIPFDKVVTIAQGDSCELQNDCWWRVLESKLLIEDNPDKITIKSDSDTPTGSYWSILICDTGWTYVKTNVVSPYLIKSIEPINNGLGRLVSVRMGNKSNKDVVGRLSVTTSVDNYSANCTLRSHDESVFNIHVEAKCIEDVNVSFLFEDTILTQSKICSFAEARESNTWLNIDRYDIVEINPSSVEPIVISEKRCTAGWKARYTDEGIFLRVEVEHKFHNAFRNDESMEGVHCNDGVKICIKGCSGDRATVIGMLLRSDTGEQVYGFTKTANEEKYPVGRCRSMRAQVVKRGHRMIYDVLVTWDMIGATGPTPGRALPFAILICKDDEDVKYQMRWFNGINYDADEGKEECMGLLWIL